MFLLSSCFNNDIAHNIIRSNWQRRQATSTPVRPSLLSCYREKAKFQILDTLQNAACRPSAGEILLSSLLFYCIWIRICFSVILCTILPLHCLLLFITILHTTLGTIADKTSKQTSNQTSKNKYTTLQKVHIRLTTEYSKQVINLIHTQRQVLLNSHDCSLALVESEGIFYSTHEYDVACVCHLVSLVFVCLMCSNCWKPCTYI